MDAGTYCGLSDARGVVSGAEDIGWPTPAKLSTLPRDEFELLAGLPTEPARRYCRMLSCLERGGVWPLLSWETEPLPGEGSPVERRPSSILGLGDSDGVLETRDSRSDRLSTDLSPSPLPSSCTGAGTAGERCGRLEELDGVPGEKCRSMGEDLGSGDWSAGCELGREREGGVRDGSGLPPLSIIWGPPWPGEMAGEGGGLRRWSG